MIFHSYDVYMILIWIALKKYFKIQVGAFIAIALDLFCCSESTSFYCLVCNFYPQFFSALITNCHSHFWHLVRIFYHQMNPNPDFEWSVKLIDHYGYLFVALFATRKIQILYTWPSWIVHHFSSRRFLEIFPRGRFCRSWTSILQKNQSVSCAYGTRCYYLLSLFTLIMQHTFVYLAILNGTSLFFSKIFQDFLSWKTSSKLDF